MAATVSANIFS